MLEVRDKVAVVTGAAGGLGLGLARQLGRRGARVVLADLDAAGVSVLGRAWELSVGDWDWVYAVNVRGAVHMVNAFVPAMIDAGEGQVIVTVSNTAVTARARYAAYGSSKHAVLSICESLQQDLSEIGSAVQVTAVLPGPIASRMADAETRRPAQFGEARNDEADAAAVREYLAANGAPPDTMAAQIL